VNIVHVILASIEALLPFLFPLVRCVPAASEVFSRPFAFISINLKLVTIMGDSAERTFIMVKPDGVQRGLVGKIIKRFEQKGFKLVGLKFVWVSACSVAMSRLEFT